VTEAAAAATTTPDSDRKARGVFRTTKVALSRFPRSVAKPCWNILTALAAFIQPAASGAGAHKQPLSRFAAKGGKAAPAGGKAGAKAAAFGALGAAAVAGSAGGIESVSVSVAEAEAHLTALGLWPVPALPEPSLARFLLLFGRSFVLLTEPTPDLAPAASDGDSANPAASPAGTPAAAPVDLGAYRVMSVYTAQVMGVTPTPVPAFRDLSTLPGIDAAIDALVSASALATASIVNAATASSASSVSIGAEGTAASTGVPASSGKDTGSASMPQQVAAISRDPAVLATLKELVSLALASGSQGVQLPTLGAKLLSTGHWPIPSLPDTLKLKAFVHKFALPLGLVASHLDTAPSGGPREWVAAVPAAAEALLAVSVADLRQAHVPSAAAKVASAFAADSASVTSLAAGKKERVSKTSRDEQLDSESAATAAGGKPTRASPDAILAFLCTLVAKGNKALPSVGLALRQKGLWPPMDAHALPGRPVAPVKLGDWILANAHGQVGIYVDRAAGTSLLHKGPSYHPPAPPAAATPDADADKGRPVKGSPAGTAASGGDAKATKKDPKFGTAAAFAVAMSAAMASGDGPRGSAHSQADASSVAGSEDYSHAVAGHAASGSGKAGKAEPICRFFLKGKCSRGDTCHFRHETDKNKLAMRPGDQGIADFKADAATARGLHGAKAAYGVYNQGGPEDAHMHGGWGNGFGGPGMKGPKPGPGGAKGDLWGAPMAHGIRPSAATSGVSVGRYGVGNTFVPASSLKHAGPPTGAEAKRGFALLAAQQLKQPGGAGGDYAGHSHSHATTQDSRGHPSFGGPHDGNGSFFSSSVSNARGAHIFGSGDTASGSGRFMDRRGLGSGNHSSSAFGTNTETLKHGFSMGNGHDSTLGSMKGGLNMGGANGFAATNSPGSFYRHGNEDFYDDADQQRMLPRGIISPMAPLATHGHESTDADAPSPVMNRVIGNMFADYDDDVDNSFYGSNKNRHQTDVHASASSVHDNSQTEGGKGSSTNNAFRPMGGIESTNYVDFNDTSRPFGGSLYMAGGADNNKSSSSAMFTLDSVAAAPFIPSSQSAQAVPANTSSYPSFPNRSSDDDAAAAALKTLASFKNAYNVHGGVGSGFS
jgi:hypothetical protein